MTGLVILADQVDPRSLVGVQSTCLHLDKEQLPEDTTALT